MARGKHSMRVRKKLSGATPKKARRMAPVPKNETPPGLQTWTVTSVHGGTTLKVGDTFTIDGVYPTPPPAPNPWPRFFARIRRVFKRLVG